MDTNMDDLETSIKKAEKELNITIPKELLNMLTINGYSSLPIISEITDDDIKNIEEFARETLPDIIEKEEYKQYYGCFMKCPQKFLLLSGHRKIINMLSKYYQETSLEIKSPTASSGESHNSRLPVRLPVEIINPSSQRKVADLTEENSIIFRTITQWIKNKLDKEKWMETQKFINNILVRCESNANQDLSCIITCYCNTPIKLTKSASVPTRSKKWIYSNFHHHYKSKHLCPSLCPNSTKLEDKSKPSSTITKYFSKTNKTEDKESSASSERCSNLLTGFFGGSSRPFSSGHKINILSDILLSQKKKRTHAKTTKIMTKNTTTIQNPWSRFKEKAQC